MASVALTPLSQFREETILIGANCLDSEGLPQAGDKGLQIINPYQNHHDILQAAEYCWSVSLEYCLSLGNVLNRIQGVSYGTAYWKTLLLPWMLAFAEILYDRYLRLCLIRKNFPVAVIQIPKVSPPEALYKKSFDVVAQSNMHSVNINLYSLLIGQMGLSSSIEYIDDDAREPERDMPETAPDRFVRFAKKNAERVLGYFHVHGGGSPFPLSYFGGRAALLSDALRITSLLKDGNFPRQNLSRGEVTFERSKDEFNNIFGQLIKLALPLSLFEEYRGRRDYAKAVLSKEKIKAMYTAETVWGNDTLKYLLSEIRQNGGKIIGCQHGGGYGQYIFSGHERVEREMADHYITWGWSDRRKCPTIPLPNPYLSTLADRHRESNKDILFIGSNGPMYMFRYQSYWVPEFVYFTYYPMKKQFFQKLKESFRERIVYRPFVREYGWRERMRIKEMVPNVRFDESSSATQSMRDCSLVVIDHPGTSFLEALAMNTPTILFWDNGQCPMREEAKPFFQLLLNAGVLHFDAGEAAAKVNDICDDVQRWWQQGEVQRARKEFCRQFARTSKNWRKEWVQFLGALQFEGEHEQPEM